MSLSVIIPTHKRPFFALRLLKSLSEQDFPFKKLQILLISNLKDKTLRREAVFWKAQFFDFKYKETGVTGVNTARNTGLRFAGGRLIYFLDDDCLPPHKKHLRNIVSAHEENPSADAIGGPYKAPKSLKELEKFYFDRSQTWMRAKGPWTQGAKLIGGNTSYKREVFDKGFCFDPTIVFGGAEESLNNLLKKTGHKLYFDENLFVFHTPKLNFPSFIKKSWQQGMGLLKNRLSAGQKLSALQDIKKEWAFFSGKVSFYSLLHSLFFKLGYFWSLSQLRKKSFVPGPVRFIKLILKSRLLFIKEYAMGWIWGHIFIKTLGTLYKTLGLIWFAIGWLWGHILRNILGPLWFITGWIWGHIFIKTLGTLYKTLGLIWFAIGWLWGHILRNILGPLWFITGWIWGHIFIKTLGTLYKTLGLIWFAIGWLWGHILRNILGPLWFITGWIWGHIFIKTLGTLYKTLGLIWFAIGWLWGYVIIKALGDIWYFFSLLLSRLHAGLFPHARPMKARRFHQFYKEKILPVLPAFAEQSDSKQN